MARCTDLESRLRTLAGEIASAQAEFMTLLAEYDTLEGWFNWGARSAADWLSNHCGHGAYTARKEVALAHALEELPVLRDTMARGAMSMDKAVAVASLATPESEPGLVELAQETTANQLARLIAASRRAIDPPSENEDAAAQRRARTLQTWWDREGMLSFRGRLTPEQGALFRKALEKGVDFNRRLAAGAGFEDDIPEPDGEADLRPDPLADADDRAGAGRADALVLMAETFLDAEPVGSGGDHYLVVVHVDAASLVDDGQGRCHIENGPVLPTDVACRLACTSSLVWLAEDADGNPVAVSPKTQDIPTSVRRAVRSRDGGCTFPTGTGGTCGLPPEFSEVHHVQHRSQGGPHTTKNCRTHCKYHHHLVHEGGFTMIIGPDGQPEYYRPDGTRIVNERPKLFDDGPPPRPDRQVEPDAAWARSNGEHLHMDCAVDLVLHYTGDLYNEPEIRALAASRGEQTADDQWIEDAAGDGDEPARDEASGHEGPGDEADESDLGGSGP